MSQIKEYLEIASYAITIAAVFVAVFAKIASKRGWKKGVLVADEIADGLNAVKEAITDLRAIPVGGEIKTTSVSAVSEKVAAAVPGVTAAEIKPIVEQLVHAGGGEVAKQGITVTMDSAGNISVDPSGAVNKAAHKIGKWAKKVF